jgi:hypothetical protein
MFALFNRFELSIPLVDASACAHSGPCDDDVAALRLDPAIIRQLDELDVDSLRAELSEYGAWDDSQLDDHDENLTRILWLACNNIKEEAHTILAHMEEEFMQPDIQYLESDPADGAEGSSEWDSGWYFRLSAPGYLDCTGWSGPFDTEEEAVEACIDMYFYDWGSL